MKNLKKLLVLSVGALVLASCSGGNTSSSNTSSTSQSGGESGSDPVSSQQPGPTVYERADDDDIYDLVLPELEGLIADAVDPNNSVAERYAKYALAEAYLMDSGLVLTTYSQGGSYAVTRVAPRRVSYVQAGNDSDKLKYCVAVAYDANKKFINEDQRNELVELWDTARSTHGVYDPVTYLTGEGFTIDDTYRTYFTSDPQTFDILATSKQRDSQYPVQGVDGLLEYDIYGIQQPRLAAALPEISPDKKTYTFTVAAGNYWYNHDKAQVAEVTADDFLAGFQHMLDAKGGLEALVDGVIEGVHEYLTGEAPFSQVGVKVNGNKVSYTLVQPESYFLSRFAYTIFHPMNRNYYVSKGGKFGSEYDPSASDYKYGQTPSDILYNGAYIIKDFSSKSKIELEALPDYYAYDQITSKKISYVYDDLQNRSASYDKAVAGIYNSWALTTTGGVLDKAKTDGIWEAYAYTSDTNTTTFFGGINVNRGTFEVESVKSNKNDQDKIATEAAVLNANFRRAIQQAWDRATWNAVSRGQDLATASMRNMYTAPNFVTLPEDVTIGNKLFTAGTEYGDMVEYFLKNNYNRQVTIADKQDGWYNPTAAKAFAATAKSELEAAGKWFGKVKIEVVYNSQDDDSTKSANAFKQVIEAVIGDYVEIVLLAAANEDDQLATSYDTETGEECCYDISWDSGWGPDYLDPSTYVDTFLPNGGYMCKVIGLY